LIAACHLPTARKLAAARWLFHLVAAARRVAGRGATDVVCRRRGVRWRLDLREGVQFALYLGVYERVTARRLLDLVRPGDMVIDVGANVGAHALPLAAAVASTGRVIAIEPTDTAFERLRANCDLNPELCERLVTLQVALGAPGGALEAGYYAAWPLVDSPGIQHPVHLGTEHGAGSARFSTLDALVESLRLPSVALVKIDVDGRELDVLRGARGVLASHRPVVVFELCPYLLSERGQTAGEIAELVAAHDYELVDEESLQPIDADASAVFASIPHGGGRNFIARPRAGTARQRNRA
jgi:FkbM family methyltransferase